MVRYSCKKHVFHQKIRQRDEFNGEFFSHITRQIHVDF